MIVDRLITRVASVVGSSLALKGAQRAGFCWLSQVMPGAKPEGQVLLSGVKRCLNRKVRASLET